MINRLITFFILIFSACLLNANAVASSSIVQQSDIEIFQNYTKPQYLSGLLAKVKAISSNTTSKVHFNSTTRSCIDNEFLFHYKSVVTHLKGYQHSQFIKFYKQKVIALIVKAQTIKSYTSTKMFSIKNENLAIL
jgi:hypothetical protein